MFDRIKKFFGGKVATPEGKTLQLLSETPPEEIIWSVGVYFHDKADHKKLNLNTYYVCLRPCRVPSRMERQVLGSKKGDMIYMEQIYIHPCTTLTEVVKKVEETARELHKEGKTVNISTPDTPAFSIVNTPEQAMRGVQ
jgi:hypothetical protein